MKRAVAIVMASAFLLPACTGRAAAAPPSPSPPEPAPFAVPASIPESLVRKIEADRVRFILELDALLAADRDGFLVLVDKRHELPADRVPHDLVPLGSKRSYRLNREGLSLRAGAEAALEKMAAAARKDGVTLVVSSSYRSYDYQKTVYERNVRELGQAAADRESARPGTSRIHHRRVRANSGRKMACPACGRIRLVPFVSRRFRDRNGIPVGKLALPLHRRRSRFVPEKMV